MHVFTAFGLQIQSPRQFDFKLYSERFENVKALVILLLRKNNFKDDENMTTITLLTFDFYNKILVFINAMCYFRSWKSQLLKILFQPIFYKLSENSISHLPSNLSDSVKEKFKSFRMNKFTIVIKVQKSEWKNC